MISKENLLYSVRNLKTKKSRSLLTILSIFIGITTIFIFLSFGLGLYSYINSLTTGSAADKIIVQNKGNDAAGLDDTFSLNEDDLQAIKKVSGVLEATGTTWGVAEIRSKDQKRFNYIVGYDPKKPLLFDISDIDLLDGRYLESGDVNKVVLGYNYKIPGKIFDNGLELGDSVELQGVKVKVIGFMEEVGSPSDDASIYLNKNYMDELYPEKIEKFSWIVAQVDVSEMDKIIEDVEKAVRKSKKQEEGKEDFYVQSFEDLVASFSGALDIVIGFVILVAFISILVSAVNTANTMITSVIERTREIGVIKSVGAQNSEILKIFLMESSILGCVAGLIGVFVGWIISSIASLILENLGWGFLSPAHPPWVFVSLVLFAVLTGAISGVIPAWRASKIKAVDALRYE